MTLLRGTNLVIDTIQAKRNVISGLGATRTLNENESGSVILLDKVDGITVTLPASATPGTWFDFVVSETLTSSAYKIITAVGTELLVGQILGCDTDTSNATLVWPALVGSSYIAVGMNKTTTGGIKGDSFRFTKLNSTTWSVIGNTNNNGTVATPFSAS